MSLKTGFQLTNHEVAHGHCIFKMVEWIVTEKKWIKVPSN